MTKQCLPTAHSRFKLGLRTFATDERGMSTVEYVILLAVIVVGAVATWKNIGNDVQESLQEAETQIHTL